MYFSGLELLGLKGVSMASTKRGRETPPSSQSLLLLLLGWVHFGGIHGQALYLFIEPLDIYSLQRNDSGRNDAPLSLPP
jgi:hypothetical protein